MVCRYKHGNSLWTSICVPCFVFLEGQHLLIDSGSVFRSRQGAQCEPSCQHWLGCVELAMQLSVPNSHDLECTSWPFSWGCLYHHIQQDPQYDSESEKQSFVFLKPEPSCQFKPIITWNHTNHGTFLSIGMDKKLLFNS